MHILRTWYWFSINRYDGLSYKSTVTHIFYGINLLYKLLVSTLNWGDEKNSLKGKKDKATNMHEVCYLRMQIIMTMNGMTQERFESMSFNFAWFSHILYFKLFHMHETFYLSRYFKVLMDSNTSSPFKPQRLE